MFPERKESKIVDSQHTFFSDERIVLLTTLFENDELLISITGGLGSLALFFLDLLLFLA